MTICDINKIIERLGYGTNSDNYLVPVEDLLDGNTFKRHGINAVNKNIKTLEKLKKNIASQHLTKEEISSIDKTIGEQRNILFNLSKKKGEVDILKFTSSSIQQLKDTILSLVRYNKAKGGNNRESEEMLVNAIVRSEEQAGILLSKEGALASLLPLDVRSDFYNSEEYRNLNESYISLTTLIGEELFKTDSYRNLRNYHSVNINILEKISATGAGALGRDANKILTAIANWGDNKEIQLGDFITNFKQKTRGLWQKIEKEGVTEKLLEKNKNGQYTGKMVTPYTEEYYKDSRKEEEGKSWEYATMGYLLEGLTDAKKILKEEYNTEINEDSQYNNVLRKRLGGSYKLVQREASIKIKRFIERLNNIKQGEGEERAREYYAMHNPFDNHASKYNVRLPANSKYINNNFTAISNNDSLLDFYVMANETMSKIERFMNPLSSVDIINIGGNPYSMDVLLLDRDKWSVKGIKSIFNKVKRDTTKIIKDPKSIMNTKKTRYNIFTGDAEGKLTGYHVQTLNDFRDRYKKENPSAKEEDIISEFNKIASKNIYNNIVSLFESQRREIATRHDVIYKKALSIGFNAQTGVSGNIIQELQARINVLSNEPEREQNKEIQKKIETLEEKSKQEENPTKQAIIQKEIEELRYTERNWKKVLKTLTRFSSLATLMYHSSAAFRNLTAGMISNLLEASAGNKISGESSIDIGGLLKASGQVFGDMLRGSFGKHTEESDKLHAILTNNKILITAHNYVTGAGATGSNRNKNIAQRFGKEGVLSFHNMTEEYIQKTLAQSFFNSIFIKDKKGKEYRLLDALDIDGRLKNNFKTDKNIEEWGSFASPKFKEVLQNLRGAISKAHQESSVTNKSSIQQNLSVFYALKTWALSQVERLYQDYSYDYRIKGKRKGIFRSSTTTTNVLTSLAVGGAFFTSPWTFLAITGASITGKYFFGQSKRGDLTLLKELSIITRNMLMLPFGKADNKQIRKLFSTKNKEETEIELDVQNIRKMMMMMSIGSVLLSLRLLLSAVYSDDEDESILAEGIGSTLTGIAQDMFLFQNPFEAYDLATYVNLLTLLDRFDNALDYSLDGAFGLNDFDSDKFVSKWARTIPLAHRLNTASESPVYLVLGSSGSWRYQRGLVDYLEELKKEKEK